MIEVDFKKKTYRISPVPGNDAVINVQCIRNFGMNVAPVTARLDTVGNNTSYQLPRPAGGGDFPDGLYRVTLFSNGQIVNSVEGYIGISRQLNINTRMQKNGAEVCITTGFPINMMGSMHKNTENIRIEDRYDMCLRYSNGVTVPLPQAVGNNGKGGYVIDVVLPRTNMGISIFVNKVFRDVVSIEMNGRKCKLVDGQVKIF